LKNAVRLLVIIDLYEVKRMNKSATRVRSVA